VATAELLNKDTKPCPKCSMGIFRIEGCDMMFCTQCHTAFDWRTGAIETRNIHNPHYFEWSQRNGNLMRNPNDIICGREIDHYFINSLRSDMDYALGNSRNPHNVGLSSENKKVISNKIKDIVELCRNIMHIRHVEIQHYTYNHELNNQELRVIYMMKDITESEFKRRLQIRHKKNCKNLEIQNILRLAVDTLTEIIYRFRATITRGNWDYNFSIEEEIEALRKYINDCFADIGHTYCSSTLKFTPVFKLESCKPERRSRKKANTEANEDDESEDSESKSEVMVAGGGTHGSP
jgi:hypothetical protein